MKKLYIGAQNDGLFIIDAPPKLSNDYPDHERKDGPNVIAKFYNNDRETGALAEKMVAAYNATIDPGRHPDPVIDAAERAALGLP